MMDVMWIRSARRIRIEIWIDAEWGWQQWGNAWCNVEMVS